MKIAVIGAMRKEIEYLLPELEDLREETKLKTTFYLGRCAGHNLVVVQSGIGKVASGILFSALIHAYPDVAFAINTGVAGGVPGRVEIGEVVVAERLAYADVDVRAGGDYAFGQLPNCPLFFPSRCDLVKEADFPHKVGTILSGDRFFSETEDISALLEVHFQDEKVLALDMESAAFAQSAWFFGVPFLSVRAVSDIIGRHGQFEEYLANLEAAARNSNKFLLAALANL